MTTPDPLDEAEKLLKEFGTPDENGIPGIKLASEKLFEAGNKLERAFSGSWAGYHGRLYYDGFKAPPSDNRFSVEWGTLRGMGEGWGEKTPEEVKAEIERLGGGATLDTIEKESEALRKRSEELRDDLVSYLSVVVEAPSLAAEKATVAALSKFKFGRTTAEYVHSNKPGQIVSRDSEAVMQGMCIPSHVYYQGVCHAGITVCESVTDFQGQASRLLRQIRLKTARGTPVALKKEDLRDLHPQIFDKCQKLFEDGALAESVEKGFKVVRDRLRELTGHETGSEAFGKGKLHIKGAAAAHVDEDFNEGVKFLTMAIDRFRNEKSHTSNAKIDSPTRAHEYLRLSSLAMRLLDDAEIRP